MVSPKPKLLSVQQAAADALALCRHRHWQQHKLLIFTANDR
jgi:hypothetical protein